LALHPRIAVVTNVEYDHPDVFPGPRFLRLAFGNFVDQIRDEGVLIACSDDPVSHAVGACYHANGGSLRLYGKDEGVGLAWRAVDIEPVVDEGVAFIAVHEGVRMGKVRLRVPGVHNVLNALAALGVATELGVPFETACAALESFTGTARRFEVLGEATGVTVIDDYAHHPTQIAAVLDAAHQRYPGRSILAVWQPHTFSRVRALWDDFLVAFEGADRVIILPIYAAREVDDGSVNHRDLAAALDHPAVTGADSLEAAARMLAQEVKKGDVVILMGAGTEYKVGEKLLKLLGGDGERED
ncbi:MAG: glutamate ligase domain-containing protein, partial [Anaerolineae bacterium]